jgi:hypothetical protein
MAHSSLSSRPGTHDRAKAWMHKRRRWIAGIFASFLAIVIVGAFFAEAHWPYRYRVVKPLLEDVLGSQIQITSYHRTYFPNPGFVAEGITLRRKSALDLPPLGSIEKLLVQGRWSDLFLLQERVRLVEMTRLHLVIPAPGSAANHEDFPPGSTSDFAGPDTMIENLLIHNGVLDVLRKNGGRFSFPIRELDVRNFKKGKANTFTVDMDNAKPRGRIQAFGEFGPLVPANLGATHASGKFTFNEVELQDMGNIGGKLASTGRFDGPLNALDAVATSDTPDFSVNDGKPTLVRGDVHCSVNGLTGEVVLHEVRLQTGKTTIMASGAVQGSPKLTNLDIYVLRGRAQDVLQPFLKDTPPVTGPVWLRAHALVGATGKDIGFLQRLKVDGVFDVPAERLTNKENEKSMSDFSDRAQGHKSDQNADDAKEAATTDAFSSLKGPARIQDGIASSQKLIFQIAGAEATMAGTFNFHSEAVHLAGDLRMQSDISHITTGFKSALLKPLAPFMRKRDAGAVVPIAVTGTPGQYKIGLDFSHKKK